MAKVSLKKKQQLAAQEGPHLLIVSKEVKRSKSASRST